MKYHVFTRREEVIRAFKESGYPKLAFHEPEKLRHVCQGLKGALIYLDLFGENRDWLDPHLPYIRNRSDLRYGVISPGDSADDPALHFHDGAVDYLCTGLMTRGLTRSRLERAQRFRPIDSRFLHSELDENIPFSGPNWDQIEEGGEYVFAMLYAGLDNMKQIRDLLGQEGAEKFTSEFREWITEQVEPWFGYQWLWSDWGGVYLFPFDGKNYYALEAAMECFLNKRIARFSYFERKTTFRFVLHLGSTVFMKRGNTGHIISDSINSLFHMAHREGSRDELVMSQEVRSHIPVSLLPYFDRLGEFEGRELYKLLKFI